MERYITSEQAVSGITIHFHSNGKFCQFYCKTHCKSVSFPALNATHLVKKTAVSQVGYFLSLCHTYIFSIQSTHHKKKKKKVEITVLLLQKREVRFLTVNKFVQGYTAIKDRTRILS